MISRSTVATVLVILLSLPLPVPVAAQDDVSPAALKSQLNIAIQTLNPVSGLLSGLVDYAISKADDALKARLEQANAIVQGAIANLNDLLKNRINQVDTLTRQQRIETALQIQNLLSDVDNNITKYLDSVDQITYERINQVQRSAGNLLGSLPLPIEPLIVANPEGFTVFKSSQADTLLTIAGSSLFKDSTVPIATMNSADGSAASSFPLKVVTRSMEYMQLAIPSGKISEGRQYVLSLKLRKGSKYFLLPEYSTPSFQLFVCSRPPTYTLNVQLEATGNTWETRLLQHPDVPAPFQLNCSPGESIDKLFQPRAHAGWEIDNSYGHEGMETLVTANDGRGEHRVTWTGNTLTLHCKGTNGEGGHQRIDSLTVAEKRVKPNSICGKPALASLPLKYGVSNEFQLSRSLAVQNCKDPALHAAPEVIVTLQLLLNGKSIETTHITDHGSGKILDGHVSYVLDQQGLLKVRMNLFCPMESQT